MRINFQPSFSWKPPPSLLLRLTKATLHPSGIRSVSALCGPAGGKRCVTHVAPRACHFLGVSSRDALRVWAESQPRQARPQVFQNRPTPRKQNPSLLRALLVFTNARRLMREVGKEKNRHLTFPHVKISPPGPAGERH